MVIQKAIEFAPTGAMYNKARGFLFGGLDRYGERLAAKHLANEVTADAAGRVSAKVAKEATQAATIEAEKKAGLRYANGFKRSTASEAF